MAPNLQFAAVGAMTTRGPKGIYANYFKVGFTAYELVIDCGQNYARKRTSCHTRIVTSPVYARALLDTLTTALDEYRQAFGNEEKACSGKQ